MAAETFSDGENHQTVREKYNATVATLNNHLGDEGNPHAVTKAQVGLGLVNNTSDADKPVSTATQTALNAKADKTELTTKLSFASAAKVGGVVRFNEVAVYGTYAAPVAGNISANMADRVLGLKVTMIHSAGGEPTYSAEFHKSKDSEAYVPGDINYYTFTCVDANRVIFKITQEL